MRNNTIIEQWRIMSLPMSRIAVGTRQGAFMVPYNGVMLRVIASDGTDWETVMPLPKWEHVSVSLKDRCPTWEELQYIKSIWWRDDETVIQIHPPKDKHINCHPYCLHLWKPIGIEIPLPPSEAIV